MSLGQTTTLPYNDDVYTNGYPSVTLNNFSTCQVSASITSASQRWTGSSWVNSNYSIIVNGTNIGSYGGDQTIDITSYIPITSVQMSGSHSSWSWVDLTVNITSTTASMPASGPSVTNITYVQGDTASPLTATLTGTGSTLKWYTDAFGDNYSATGPTPSTATVGTTSYFVAQANASGCESVRSEIVVTVVPNTPATHLNFDGTNDHVNLGTSLASVLNGATTLTFEAWINPSVLNGWNNIITDYDGAYHKVLLRVRNNNNIQFWLNSTVLNSPFTVPLNTWTHIAAVYDGSNMYVYANGTLIASQAAPASLPSTTNPFYIGNRIGGSELFTGNLDEIRVWTTARTAEQIAGSMNCELQGSESGLVAYYKFNQGINQADNSTVTTLTDATSNGHNGTLTNFALTGTTSNWLSGSPVTTGSVIPSAAAATTPVIYNQGDTASALLATTGTNGTGLMWYTSATGGTGSTMAPTPSTTTAGSTSYWVSSTNANGCESARIEIVVTVNANATNLNFDGVNDNVAIPASAINNLNQGTIEVWVYPTASVLDNQTICAKQSNFENTYAFLSIGGASAANGRAYYQSTNSAFIQSNSTIIPNQWTHIAVAFTSTQAKIYINGVLDNTVTGSFSLPNDTSVTATTIGAILGDGNGQYFTGSIDEFRVWNVALTDADITATMNCEAQMQPELVTYYKFNQGFDNADNAPVLTLNDELGNSNGTLSNFSLTGATSNWKAGSAVTSGNSCATLSNSDFDTVSNLNVYPNPSKGIFNINTEEVLAIEIYDIVGKLVKTTKLEIGTSSVDISNLNSGVYLLKTINSENKSQVFKLIKE